MKLVWPWVSRRAYDAKCEQLAYCAELLRDEVARSAAIVDRMIDLKKDGFMPTPVAPVIDIPTLDPLVTLEISNLAGNQRALTMQLTRYAFQATQKGVPVPKILEALRHGEEAA